MAQFVELTQVLLPAVVDDVKHDGLLELLHHRLRLGVVGFTQVARDVVDTLAVGDGHKDALVHLALILEHLLDDRPSDALQTLGLACESMHSSLEGLLVELVAAGVDELLACERTLHREHLQELLAASLIVVVVDDVDGAVPDDVGDIHTDTLTHQGVTALLVDNGALLVHHIIVLEQMLTNTEVVLLDLLLCALDVLGDHTTLDALTLLEAQTVHHRGDALRAEQTHELVLK